MEFRITADKQKDLYWRKMEENLLEVLMSNLKQDNVEKLYELTDEELDNLLNRISKEIKIPAEVKKGILLSLNEKLKKLKNLKTNCQAGL